MQRGFGVIEIVLALGIFLIVLLSVFQFAGSLQRGVQNESSVPGIDIYKYGETACAVRTDAVVREDIDMSFLFSTSTPITSLHILFGNRLLLTTDSSSTTEPDIFITNTNFQLIESKDVGPGLLDAVVMGTHLYVANTSANSHVKSFDISYTIQEIGNIKINSLSQSSSLPRRISMFGNMLVVGAEKSSTGGELFFFPVSTSTGLVGELVHAIELNGQAHQSTIFQNNLLVSNSADPELHIYSMDGSELLHYDAPLTLGNGKSVLALPPYIVFGRTLGSGELSLLTVSSSSIYSLDIKRTQGTVDGLEHIPGEDFAFIAFTANTDKEIQFWKVGENEKLTSEHSIDIPARMSAYSCQNNILYIALLINEKQHILKIW